MGEMAVAQPGAAPMKSWPRPREAAALDQEHEPGGVPAGGRRPRQSSLCSI